MAGEVRMGKDLAYIWIFIVPLSVNHKFTCFLTNQCLESLIKELEQDQTYYKELYFDVVAQT